MQVIERPLTLVDQVIAALRKEIAEGRFAPASRLPAEQELARTLGCSRPVIREAVSQLKADGVLVTTKGVGAYVAANPAGSVFRLPRGDTSAKDLAQLFELRFWMETAAAEAAALRRKTADLARMRDALKRMERHAGDYPAASKADVDFHAAIAGSTQNAYLVAFSGFIEGHLLKAREMGWQNSARLAGGPRPAQQEHLRLFDAIQAKDPDAARQAAAAHLLASGRRMGLDVQKLERMAHPDRP
ncbi:FadR family transcriptional regulator [Achromobacter xylosoxidans]|uniref:FadR/GntR family transcriptional regulator n=1 Tax=Alcaligenes xylosoxydans xylosoxydans TaxID=85698 RepID=UPI00122F1528|nr:FCD domain-containing protein [Achromobacter xylosoxidans]QEQ20954.1 FadR family transcriptional regulator [Achromobacter xylosoxidans]